MSYIIYDSRPEQKKEIYSQYYNKLNEIKKCSDEIINHLKSLGNHLKSCIEKSQDSEKNLKRNIDDYINRLDSFFKDSKDIEQKEHKSFYDNIIKYLSPFFNSNFEIYENNYIKKLEEINDNLNKKINDIGPIEFFDPNPIDLNLSSQSTLNDKNNNSLNSFDFFCFNIDNINKSKNSGEGEGEDKSMKCSVCKKYDSKYFCEECNQLYCDSCYNSFDKKSKHNIKQFNLDKSQINQEKMAFLNSVIFIIKSLLIKTSYMISNDEIKIDNIYQNNDDNNNKSSFYIQRKLNYPFIKNININNFDEQINFLNEFNYIINKFLLNNFNFNFNLDIHSYNKSQIHEAILAKMKNIVLDENNPNKFYFNPSTEIEKLLEDEEISDEIYLPQISLKQLEEEYNKHKNDFHYIIYLISQKNQTFNKSNFKKAFLNKLKDLLELNEKNIILSFNKNINNDNNNKNSKEFIDRFIKTNTFLALSLNEIKKYYPSSEQLYEYKNIYDNILKNKEYFDIKGNKICFNSSNNLVRGTEKYYPPNNWLGIGLKVKGKYKNDQWLDPRSKDWAIAYYSITQTRSSNHLKEILNNIIVKNELSNGNFQLKCSSDDKRNNGKKVGTGIYLYQDINMAEKFTNIININGKRYKVILMAKVLINKIKEPIDINYWIFQKKDYIRFYRILVKEYF